MSFFNFALKALQGGVETAALRNMKNQKPKNAPSKCTPCAANAYVQGIKAQSSMRARGGR